MLGDNNCLATSKHASVLDLPTNDDLSKCLDCATEDIQKSLINETCVVVWMEEEMQWYLGFVCKDIGDDNYLVEHLERHPPSQNDFWRHPKVEDVQTVFKGKILPCRVDGVWEILAPAATRIDSKYHLKNSQQIKNQFTKIIT